MERLELWLIRHGETLWNKTGRIQGVMDIPLNETGIEQAERLAKRIGHRRFDRVYSSDLSRAKMTAEIVFPKADLNLDTRLREINLGKFEGASWQDLTEEEQQEYKVWFLGPYNQRVPQGESNDDLRERVSLWLRDLPLKGSVIAFAHGGTIASIIQTVTGRPKPRQWNEAGGWGLRFFNTSISTLIISDTYVTIERLNDAAHLEKNDAYAG